MPLMSRTRLVRFSSNCQGGLSTCNYTNDLKAYIYIQEMHPGVGTELKCSHEESKFCLVQEYELLLHQCQPGPNASVRRALKI